jgi:hypothetical protein
LDSFQHKLLALKLSQPCFGVLNFSYPWISVLP